MVENFSLKPIDETEEKHEKESKLENISDTSNPKEIWVRDIKMRNDGIYVIGKIENTKVSMLMDTGANLTIISNEFFEKLGTKPQIKPASIKLTSASGDNIPVKGQCTVEMCLEDLKIPQKIIVAKIKNPCILGLNFMNQNSCNIYVKKMKLKIQGIEIPCFRKKM